MYRKEGRGEGGRKKEREKKRKEGKKKGRGNKERKEERCVFMFFFPVVRIPRIYLPNSFPAYPQQGQL